MVYDAQTLRAIYDKTDGYCHICHRKVSIKNYAAIGKRGAWEVEHSHPRAKGGTDHGSNLYAACVQCNRNKSDYTTRTARRWHGTARAPYSKEKKNEIRRRNATAGGIIGGLIGLAGGPLGVAVCAFVGTAIGKSIKPPKA